MWLIQELYRSVIESVHRLQAMHAVQHIFPVILVVY